MIELVFTVCLVAAPETCEDRHLTFTENIGTRQCLIGAQPHLARWNEANPKWRIGRWKCRPVAARSRDA